MTSPLEPTIEERLRKLERQNRLLIGTVAAICVACTGAIITGCVTPGHAANATPKEVRAKRFVLVDGNGETMGMWGMEKDAQVLRFGDSPNTQRLLLHADGNQSMMGIYAGGYPRSWWRVSRRNGAALGMVNTHDRVQPQGKPESEPEIKKVSKYAKSSWAMMHMGSETKLILRQKPHNRVDLSAGRIDPKLGGAHLNLSENDKVRISLGKNHYTANKLAMEFKSDAGNTDYRIPPTGACQCNDCGKTPEKAN